MPLLLHRAKCGQTVSVPDDREGALLTCPKCRVPLIVPPPLPSATEERGDRVHLFVWASVGGGFMAVVVLVVATWPPAAGTIPRPSSQSRSKTPRQRRSPQAQGSS